MLANDWLNGRFALGRSTIGKVEGSYASFDSSAKMLLFFTRLACIRRSTLGRRFGEDKVGDISGCGEFSVSKRDGDMWSRVVQKSRGVPLMNEGGDEFSVYGEDSRETIAFYTVVSIDAHKPEGRCCYLLS